MKLATLRTAEKGTTAALVTGSDSYLALPASDVGALLAQPQWRTIVEKVATAGGNAISGVAFAPLLPRAGKVICCGLNYGDHIQEMGRDLPEFPTLFAKYADTLTGPADTIHVHGSVKVDWEAELAVVVGSELFRADEDEARNAIAGYTVANDVSMRDWQNRTLQWFQGKAFDRTTPVGPVMLTADEADGDFEVRGYVNGELVQHGNTSTLVFGPAKLLSYISQFTILRPGDLVLTGTPGGVGMGMTPPRFLNDGDVLTTEIDGIGRLENHFRIHAPVPANV
ncbi:fumarylacetoacetate hydrolase family protein [Arthrobacter bambusae]|uniref:2-keto-4-pentenoate hydratase/2-oxohepta-3-ene-1,7-dioic acid hydratase in catechol pathway n=1 Tax=Arthrobacter bambusae TaxID=1338426 RepID=A0AAW8DCY8_9MICC|nr:fumarylacetoacetate hydrolase family protein [Arthrobacter bambusae]MDP9906202.1 2-keto-4-pentenoate hydratase/2-oxohepta-3-ene-1,7-dioic acid hydratase in catechol pathway [Arthrobacter bambusae]MDQ0130565.1 2-keto-4-pentenoate hydratase/2-oxohepta-3-ene-1,7-dioic acid hydratase in catechol pathway [Arthrobacter bambusae]MDQ0182240.1 2-keto-4-pentenoate hydratase/2-oxohepta-3-ene-1,7-dioic acid hydratase in catechol pathway [Arthrobacter bambusae]